MNDQTQTLLNNLNPTQKAAVIKPDGVALVIAGAGSGKTRVITSRISYLITELGAFPRSIVGLTFTNKAANEMKERIHTLLPEGSGMPFVGTFHSYCLLLLRTYKRFTGVETFSIMDSDDQKSMLKRLLDTFKLDTRITPTQMQHAISCLKNNMTKQLQSYSMQNMIQQLYIEYEAEKKRANVLDFDDLMIRVLELFKTNPEFKAEFQLRIKHILVDEYQDTNTVQHDLLKQMALRPDGTLSVTSLCAVGDEDQSIYSWRGAQVENMRLFKDDFAPVETIKIEQNYPSAQPILTAANTVISHNRNRTAKNLWSAKNATNRILLATCGTAYQEADLISITLNNLPESITRGQAAVLYRTHAQTRVLEEALMRAGTPYTIIGGIRFYERKEIKDVLAFMRLIDNPVDRVSLLRVLNVPARGLGEKVEGILLDTWNSLPGMPFSELLSHLISHREQLGLSKAHERGLREFLEIFEGITRETGIAKIYELIIERTSYLDYLAAEYEREEFRSKSENLRELYHSIVFFEKKALENSEKVEAEAPLTSFLTEIALLQEKINDDTEQADTVKLMTLHSAKGLEFNLIIISGLEETVLPSSRSMESREDIEEERRLFYVGITRAREYLLISHALTRSTYGQRASQEASRFLRELPDKEINATDFSDMYSNEITRTINTWFGNKQAAPKFIKFGLSPEDLPQFVAARNREKPSTTHRQPPRTIAKPSHVAPAGKSNKQIWVEPLAGERLKNSGYQNSSPWKIHAEVYHATFGTGKIISVEQRADDKYLVTANFRSGQKTVLSSFLQLTPH